MIDNWSMCLKKLFNSSSSAIWTAERDQVLSKWEIFSLVYVETIEQCCYFDSDTFKIFG